MKTIILDLTNASGADTTALTTTVSFRKFIEFVSESARLETALRREYLEKAIEQLTSQPGFSSIKTVQDTTEFAEQLHTVYQLLTPNLDQQENIVWAIGMPLSPVMFYGTDSFYDMITDSQTSKLRSEMITDESVAISAYDKVLPVYSLVLQRLYGITTPGDKPMVISIKDKKTALLRYFRINIDHRFTDVFPTGRLPEINAATIHELLADHENIGQFLELLPMTLFRFEGISIITLTDVTTEYILEHIKTILLEKQQLDHDTFYRRITDALKVLVANSEIDFGLIPQLRVNKKLVIDRNIIFHSKLVSTDLPEAYFADIYSLFAAHFIRYPDTVFLSGIYADDKLVSFAKAIKTAGIMQYAMLPVYNDGQIVGLFEIYSTENILLDQNILSKISPAMQLISRIFQNKIDEFNISIETVIKERFTSLQESVQWKFKEAAWHFLRDSNSDQLPMIGKISFPNVYPLYGAVDIRNSTSARNMALREDLRLQFDLILKILSELSQKSDLLLAEEMTYKCKIILSEIEESQENPDEMKIAEFLELDLHPFLRHFQGDIYLSGRTDDAIRNGTFDNHQSLSIRDYFESLEPVTGAFYANRRELEKSMQLINSTINNALDTFKMQIQPLYPVYFEKFRTDGVEYDIYIGQSIDPEIAFNSIYLKNVKLLQLSTMAAIVKLTHALLPDMKKPLQTTQLIFVNSGTIDVSFRDDERRFDVEGAYNIRYQVIKKRIDKAHVKETGERLTQPGKIALVYFQDKAISDYLNYVRFLQAQNVFSDDLEFLELEELQGVAGLRALRVGVRLES